MNHTFSFWKFCIIYLISAVEREVYDRLSFWHFLGCPDKIPDMCQRSGYFGHAHVRNNQIVDTLVRQYFVSDNLT